MNQLCLGLPREKRGNEEFDDEEFLTRKRRRGKRGKIVIFKDILVLNRNILVLKSQF